MSNAVLVRRVGAVSALLSALLWAATARADELPTAQLRYVVIPSCRDESAFRTLMVSRMGRDPFVSTQKDAQRVEITVTTVGNRVEARVRVANGKVVASDRRLVDRKEHCDDLLEAVATAVAIAIDPMASPGSGSKVPKDPPPPPVAAPTPPPKPMVVLDEPPKPAPVAAIPWVWQVHGALGVSVAQAPGPMVGGELGFGVEHGSFVIGLEGRGETQPSSALQNTVELEATLLSGAIVPCFRYEWLDACGVARIGVLQGRSPSVATPSLGSSLIGALGARAALSIPLGRVFRLTPRAELAVPLVRTTLLVDQKPVWTAPAIGGHFGIEIGFRIP